MKFKFRWSDISLTLVVLILTAPLLAGEYYPSHGEWERHAPEAVGLISDLHRPVARWIRNGHFESEHNRQISWHHLLQQTSDWIDQLRQPAEARPDYGYMWWLNTGKERITGAPEEVFFAAGFGGNYIYVDQENDLLIVLRWVPELAAVVEAVLAALKPKTDL